MALHLDTSVTLTWTTSDATTQKTATLTPTGGRTPVGIFALSTHDLWDGSNGWDALTITYGGVSLGSIRTQDAEAGFVSDSWALGGKAAIAARANNTVTVTPTASSTLAKSVFVGLVYSDVSANDAAYNSANAGGTSAAVTTHTLVVAHTGTLASGSFGVGAFAQPTGSNGSTGLVAGNTFRTTFSFGTDSVDYTTADNASAASSTTLGYSTAPNTVYSAAAVVFAEILAPVPAGTVGMFGTFLLRKGWF